MNTLTLTDNKDIEYSSFRFTKNSVVPLGNPTLEQWKDAWQFVGRADGAVRFWRGDLIRFAENEYGEMYTQYINDFNKDYQTLRNDKSVADNIEMSRRRDNLSFSHHEEVAWLPSDEQEKLLDIAEDKQLNRNEFRRVVSEFKKAKLPKVETPTGKYEVIVIDPPWDMEFMKLEMRPNQVEMPYPTMTLDEIKAFPITDIAADNCSLFLWTTHTYLPNCFSILEAWGFKYHVTLTWDKTNGRSLFGFNRRTEFVIYAYKGNINVNQRGKFIDTIFTEKLREHSRKPDIFYEMIKTNTPDSRIDIFSREKREGFEQWGNEIEKF